MARFALLVAACASPSLLPSNHASAPSSYAAIVGRWTATVLVNTGSWPIEIDIRTDAPVGRVVGTVTYPTYACGGDLVRQPDKGDTLVVRVRLAYNRGDCADGGKLELRRGATGLALGVYWPNDTAAGASAVLHR